jgi:hypothetical protein
MEALAAASPRRIPAPRVVASSVAVLLVGAAALALIAAPDRRTPPDTGSAAVQLERTPYLGVACPKPNRIECGRVGLYVWLERPLARLEAVIAGRQIQLTDRGHGPSRAKGVDFEGFLQRRSFISRVLGVRPDTASGKWIGSDAPRVKVRLIGYTADGRSTTKTVRLRLAAGYG